MNGKSDPADESEKREAHGNEMAHHLVGDEHAEFPGDERVELARAVAAAAELIGKLPEANRLGRGCQQVEEDLEALSRQAAHGVLEDLAAHHEEAAHGIGDRGLADNAAELRREVADLGAPLAQIADAAAAHI